MNKTMLQKAKLNALAGYINLGFSSILMFFLSPYLIQFLGSYSFGIWKSLQKILSFASIADGRATQALKWIIANVEGNDDIKEKQQAIGSAVKVWIFFSPLMFVIVIVIVWQLPVLINGIDFSMYNLVRMVGFILGANLIINPLLEIPDAILIGTNNGYKSTNIQTISLVFSNFLMVYSSYLGYGIIGLAYVVLLITIINAILIFYICKKDISWLGIQRPTKDQIHKFFGFSFWILIWSFIEKLLLSTEIILIGYLINPEAVTNYIFTTYILQLAIPISLLTGSAVTPGLGKLIGSNEMDKARSIVINIREIIIFVSILFGSFILIMNESFVTLWMGETYYMGKYSNLLIVLISIQLIMLRIEAQIQDLSLNIKRKVLVGALFSAISIALGLLFYNLLGNIVEGLFIGILIGRIAMNLILKKMVNKMMNIKTNYLYYIYILLFLILSFYTSKLFSEINTWWSFIFAAFGLGLVLLLASFQIFLSKESKSKLVKLIIKQN